MFLRWKVKIRNQNPRNTVLLLWEFPCTHEHGFLIAVMRYLKMKQQQHDINFEEDSEKNPSPRWDNVCETCVGPPPPPPPTLPILLLKYHLNHWYFPLVCTGGVAECLCHWLRWRHRAPKSMHKKQCEAQVKRNSEKHAVSGLIQTQTYNTSITQ